MSQLESAWARFMELEGFSLRKCLCWGRTFASLPKSVRMAKPRNVIPYAGLKKQYVRSPLNAILQILYHLPLFRKISLLPGANPPEAPVKAIEDIFLKLGKTGSSSWSVSAEALTTALNLEDAGQQWNGLKTIYSLFNALETKMERALNRLFGGQQRALTKCSVDGVDHKSFIDEPFKGLVLNINGCNTLEESLDLYTRKHVSENRHYVEGHGYQVVERAKLFVDLPPVLLVHLNRFDYDGQDGGVKINDRFVFPLEIDLDMKDGKYVVPFSVKENTYGLYSVLVHRGDLESGNYYSFIRPTSSNQWFKFEDDKVTAVADIKIALNKEAYGGPKKPTACMLVYIRGKNETEMMWSFADEEGQPQPESKLSSKCKFSRKQIEEFCAQATKENYSAMPPVVDQKSCNCCMVAALMGAASGRYCIANSGLRLLFAMQHCIDCAETKEGVKVDSSKCRHISSKRAYDFLWNPGVTLAKKYKFVGQGGECRDREMEGLRLLIESREDVPADDGALKYIDDGPITGVVEITPDFICPLDVQEVILCEEPLRIDKDGFSQKHGFAIHGYGERCGVKFFLGQNSWSDAWGCGGQFMVKCDKVKLRRCPVGLHLRNQHEVFRKPLVLFRSRVPSVPREFPMCPIGPVLLRCRVKKENT